MNAGEKGSSPVFILSAGRSGSTLLRKILLRSGKIAIPPESFNLIPALALTYIRFNFLPWPKLIDKLIKVSFKSKVLQNWDIRLEEKDILYLKVSLPNKSLAAYIQYLYLLYAEKHYPNADLWGDKTPMLIFNTEELQKIFPTARYILLVRDGRDVISSYIDHNIYSDVLQLSKRWLRSLNVISKLQKELAAEQQIVIKYEDLVQNPEKEITKICLFLNIEYNESFIQNSSVHMGDDFLNHHGNTLKVINTDSIGKWKEKLTEAQKIEVLKLIQDGLRKWGYS